MITTHNAWLFYLVLMSYQINPTSSSLDSFSISSCQIKLKLSGLISFDRGINESHVHQGPCQPLISHKPFARLPRCRSQGCQCNPQGVSNGSRVQVVLSYVCTAPATDREREGDVTWQMPMTKTKCQSIRHSLRLAPLAGKANEFQTCLASLGDFNSSGLSYSVPTPRPRHFSRTRHIWISQEQGSGDGGGQEAVADFFFFLSRQSATAH
ncbi:hypothetical protein BJV74DRAFT_150776 [Russula compacta]|nr:hypothetical protein BJV74DRAFT_150776 [Russula compacta]